MQTIDPNSSQPIHHAPKATIAPRAIHSPVPLSDNQTMEWNMLMNESGKPTAERMRAAALRIHGPLSVSALEESINLVVNRHESLRAQIVEVGETPAQYIRSDASFRLNTIDISSARPTDADLAATAVAREFFGRRIHLSIDPLLDSLLLKLPDDEYVLLLAVEHMASDGASLAIINKEVWSGYGLLSAGSPVHTSPQPLQYGDYSVWQAQTRMERQKAHESYWLQRATGAPRITLPYDFERDLSKVTNGSSLTLPFGKKISDSLRQLAQRENVLLPLVVLTIYVTVMSRFCEQPDWNMPFASNGRYGRDDFRDAVGFYAKPLLFRVNLADSSNLLETLKLVQTEFAAATSHQDYVPPIPEGCSFELLFNWGAVINYSKRWSIEQQRRAAPDLRVQPFPLEENLTIALIPFFSDTPAGVVANIKYHPERFARSTVEKLGEDFRSTAVDLLAQSGLP